MFNEGLFSSAATPNSSSLDLGTPTNNGVVSNGINATSIISADSSVASSVSLDDDDEAPSKVKKKDENHVSVPVFGGRKGGIDFDNRVVDKVD